MTEEKKRTATVLAVVLVVAILCSLCASLYSAKGIYDLKTEANAAQEAARVGVAVLTTIHSNSCEATYRRMVSLCKRAVDMSDETLLSYVTEAYPIVVFCKQLENKQRRMMEIMECEILPGGERRYNTLFRYVITENHMENGKFIIEGHHAQINEISASLRKRLLENGMPNEELQALLNPKKEVNAT